MVKKVLKSNWGFGLVVLIVPLLAVTAAAQDTPAILEISGKVTDASGRMIEDAVVKAVGSDVSPVLTDAEGRYKFYLVGQKDFFTLHVSKEGYVVRSSRPIDPNTQRRRVTFDAALEVVKQPPITVEMKKFISGVLISGKVTGVKAEDLGEYKVLVYVLTNQWYIHPYAENKDGTGYASIKSDGSWKIRTINRKHHPFNLAILIVPKNYVPPSVIAVGEDAEQSLRARIGERLCASQIIPAPEGL